MCEQLISNNIEQFAQIIDSHSLISITDTDGYITCVSHAFCILTGYTQKELIGKTHSILHHPDTHANIYTHMWETIKKGAIWHGQIKNQTKNNQTYWVDSFIQPLFNEGKITSYIAISKNITKELTYEKFAKLDSLTGLFNRYAIEELLHLFLQEANRYKTSFSVIMVDIDDFKATNDLYGHLTGDKVLKELSSLFQTVIRESDRIGRWGGEEFMILLPHTTYKQAFNLAQRLCKKCYSHKFDIIKHKTASFGVAVHTENDTLISLTAKADKALYVAKRNGKNQVS